MELEQLKYIAVEGPIGVGKTALTKMLALDLGARSVLEDPDSNPFLPLFYQDPTKHALQAQLFFLLSRYQQQIELKQQDLFDQKIVCDYVFAKDHIFAQMNLTKDEWDLYSQVYKLLDQRLPKPEVTIFLQANPDVLIKRIKKRNIAYEKKMDPDYIKTLSACYSEFFFNYSESPLLVINTSDLDFVNQLEDYATLKQELLYLIKSGKHIHYVTINQN